jgi:hypothetical protein
MSNDAIKEKILVVFLLMLSVPVFSHEKGDIVLNPEFQGGFVYPLIVPDFNAMGINGNNAGSIGFDYAARITGHYFFTPRFSANAGVGIGGLMAFSGYDYANGGGEIKVNNTYRVSYGTIPFGVRYNIKLFALGGGFAVNIPFDSFHEEKNDSTQAAVNDRDFTAKTFLSWYIDVGLDFAGRERHSSGFGIALRTGSSFSDIADDTPAQKFNNFGYLHVSLLLHYMFKIARF